MKSSTSEKKGLVISDLHLFSRRSKVSQFLKTQESILHKTDILVLNGDTFDFRWSHYPSEAATVTAAITWLRTQLDNFPEQEVHFLLGNHDCLTSFRTQLEELTRLQPRIHLHEFWLQLDRLLFLHGDCSNRFMNDSTLRSYREQWSRDKPRGPIYTTLYTLIDYFRISHCFHFCYFPKAKTIQRVIYYLDQTVPDWRTQIDDCFFGHTHMPFHNHPQEGIRFHNTGSAITGMGFHPISFKLTDYHPSASGT